MQNRPTTFNTTRRQFLKTTAAAAVAVTASPLILRAENKSGSKNAIVGSGEHQYECFHGWGMLPNHIQWGDTHGVCVDEAGLIYIKHRAHTDEPMDSIVVFDENGRFVRSFGKEYHRGGHGIDIRKEGNEQFLYLSDTRNCVVAKSTLKGEQIWSKGYPKEAEVYNDGKARYKPTNLAFAPDGGLYVGDGYGSHYIHQYDADMNWVRTWGGEGSEPGKMKTPHGMWLDDRPSREPSLVVADRANARLQYFSLDGKHLSFVEGMSFPADIDIKGDVMLVPDLHARITLLDGQNQVLTHLGYDSAWTAQALKGFTMRKNPASWREGRFIHPHDACFDHQSNIYVAEWVYTGRVSFLKKVS